MTNEGSGSSSPMTLMSLQHSHNPHASKCNTVCYCCYLFVLLTLKQSAYLMELDTLGATLCGSEECHQHAVCLSKNLHRLADDG